VSDIFKVKRAAADALGTIEYRPGLAGVGGIPLALWSRRHIAYFPSSPLAACLAALGNNRDLGTVLRGAFFALTGAASMLAADHVLVRDTRQYAYLRRLGMRRVSISRPVVCSWPECQEHRKRRRREFRVLFVGVLRRVKGLDTLLPAVASARRQLLPRHDLVLTLVGGASASHQGNWTLDEVRQYASSLGFDEHSIRLTGYVADAEALQAIYADSDALVHPAYAEGFPRVIDEAMLAGLPVITTDIPQMSMVLRRNEEALLVRPGDARALASAIVQLVRDETLRERLVGGSRRRAAGLRTETAARQHLDLLVGGSDG
jgi:glycosyltransferase involved in cell wall biosynthesis